MSVSIFDSNGRDANGNAMCAVCCYPYPGLRCCNPGCRTNRSDAQNAADDAERDKRAAQEAERQKFAAIRYAGMSRR